MRFTPLTRIFSLSAALGFSAMSQGQTGITVAGFGYHNPSNRITAAPGQTLMVSVFGVSTRIPLNQGRVGISTKDVPGIGTGSGVLREGRLRGCGFNFRMAQDYG